MKERESMRGVWKINFPMNVAHANRTYQYLTLILAKESRKPLLQLDLKKIKLGVLSPYMILKFLVEYSKSLVRFHSESILVAKYNYNEYTLDYFS